MVNLPPDIPQVRELQVNKKIECHITWAQEFGDNVQIYIVDASNKEDFEKLDIQLNADNFEKIPYRTPPREEDLCLAESDGLLARASLVHVSQSTCTVFYFDYGNTVEVPIKDVYPLPDSVKHYPAFCYATILRGKFDSSRFQVSTLLNTWTTTTYDITVRYMNTSDEPVIDLYSKDNKMLLNETYMLPNSLKDGILPTASQIPGEKYRLYRKHLEQFDKAVNTGEEMVVDIVDAQHDQICGHVKSIEAAKVLEYANMNNTMQEHYSQEAESVSYLPNIDEVVASKYEGEWYRGVVISVNQAQKCAKVFYLDYANTETVSFGSMRPLAKRFNALKVLAISFKLANVNRDVPREELEPYASGAIIHVVANGNPISVKLYSSDKSTCLNDKLAPASSPRPVPSPQGIISPLGRRSASRSPVMLNQMIMVYLPSKVKVTCEIVDFDSNDNLLVFVIPAAGPKLDSANRLRQLLSEYTTPADSSYAPLDNEMVIAKYHDGFYRAVVLQTRGDRCEVFFTDFGNTDAVPRALITPISDRFTTQDMLAVKCSLFNVDEKFDFKEEIAKMVGGADTGVQIEVISQRSSILDVVDVKLFNGTSCLNDLAPAHQNLTNGPDKSRTSPQRAPAVQMPPRPPLTPTTATPSRPVEDKQALRLVQEMRDELTSLQRKVDLMEKHILQK